MKLSIRQRSNIRFFAFYLVNGTLDYSLLNEQLGMNFHEYLKSHPDLFFKTCSVFINQEMKLSPDWPFVRRLADYGCKCVASGKFEDFEDFETWETDHSMDGHSISCCFKRFSLWFTELVIDGKFEFRDFIDSGATFVEQCFAIWGNVVDVENGVVVNYDYCLNRVLIYMNSYFSKDADGRLNDLEEWEWELHFA
jgi:hypothetical protein